MQAQGSLHKSSRTCFRKSTRGSETESDFGNEWLLCCRNRYLHSVPSRLFALQRQQSFDAASRSEGREKERQRKMCQTDSLPSYGQFFRNLSILLTDYWSGNYDHANCDKFAPSYTRFRWNDVILVSFLTSLFACVHLVGGRLIRWQLSQRFPSVPVASIRRSSEILCDCFVRLALITLSTWVLFGGGLQCSVLWSQRDMVYHSHLALVAGYPMSFLLRLTIALQAASYLWSSVALVVNSARKDAAVLFAHHIITLGLLYIGYTYNQGGVGIWIALLHDVADPFIDVMRVVKSLGLLTMCLFNDLLYVFCLSLWISSRLLLFPLTAIHPIVLLSSLSPSPYCNHEYIGSVSSFLAALLFLNFVWTLFIARLGFFRLRYGLWTDVTSEGRSERREELRRRKRE